MGSRYGLTGYGSLLKNIALIYQGKIIAIRMVETKRAVVCTKLKWRKLYGPKFRQCTTKINFNETDEQWKRISALTAIPIWMQTQR
jgi:hypothetical protein